MRLKLYKAKPKYNLAVELIPISINECIGKRQKDKEICSWQLKVSNLNLEQTNDPVKYTDKSNFTG